MALLSYSPLSRPAIRATMSGTVKETVPLIGYRDFRLCDSSILLYLVWSHAVPWFRA